MKIDFTGKTVLVTGHSRGIGLAIYDLFKANGATVFGVSSNEVDFSDLTKTMMYAKELCNRIGFDILVNCAGINMVQPIVSISDTQKIMNVNFHAPLIFANAVCDNMVDKNWGRIVNIGSIYSEKAKSNRIGYVSSKHALLGQTRCLSMELYKYGILVNMVSPSVTDTDMTESIMGIEKYKIQMLQPIEIANTVVALCSKYNTAITGENIIVKGGINV